MSADSASTIPAMCDKPCSAAEATRVEESDDEWGPGLDERDLAILEHARRDPDRIVESTPKPPERLGYFSVVCLILNRSIGINSETLMNNFLLTLFCRHWSVQLRVSDNRQYTKPGRLSDPLDVRMHHGPCWDAHVHRAWPYHSKMDLAWRKDLHALQWGGIELCQSGFYSLRL